MPKPINNNTVVLAFSGGLDTTFCVPYLQEQGYDVITVTVDTGGFTKKGEIEEIEQKSKSLGAIKHFTIDAKDSYYKKIISYVIKANALRGGVYPLLVGPERVMQAMKVIEIAEKENAFAVAHGSTGAGNDQVRFDSAIRTLSPKLKIIAPIRELSMTRDQEYQYLEEHSIPIKKVNKVYSINHGMLGSTVGGKETLGSWESPPDTAYPTLNPIENAPDKPQEIILTFKKGLPIKVNGKGISPVELLYHLYTLGAEHGVGKNIHLGDTILGIKGRVAFEAPVAEILIKAHRELEKLVLTKNQMFWKDILSQAYQGFLHEAEYFDPIVKDIEMMIDSSQNVVCGEVRVKLYKGNVIIIGVKSKYSLMNTKIATYGEENKLWSGKDVEGFCKIYGLQGAIANSISKHHQTLSHEKN